MTSSSSSDCNLLTPPLPGMTSLGAKNRERSEHAAERWKRKIQTIMNKNLLQTF